MSCNEKYKEHISVDRVISIKPTGNNGFKTHLLQLLQGCDPADFGVCCFGLLAGVFAVCLEGWGVAT